MPDIKPGSRYIPNMPPREASDPIRQYLREELDFIALVLNDSQTELDTLRSRPRMVLDGDADDFTLDATEKQFVNYAHGGHEGFGTVDPDPVAGEMTIPLAAAYSIHCYAIGLQGNSRINASIFLYLGVNGATEIIYCTDVSNNRTPAIRCFSAVFTREFDAGDVITMWLGASGDMGTFSVTNTSLEITFIHQDQ